MQHREHIYGPHPITETTSISFYYNEEDAWAETDPITDSDGSDETVLFSTSDVLEENIVWARVEYVETNCATVVSFHVIVNSLPDVTGLPTTPLELCDDTEDGEDNNGYVQSFMLTDKDAEIIESIGIAATITYHFSLSDAEAGANPISSPFANTIPDSQTLWVRVTSEDTGCYSITTLTLLVNPLPSPEIPEPLEACDDDANGYADFDLDDPALIEEIQNGEIDVLITFHETLTDAQNNDNILVSPYSSINPETQTIFARDTYTATGCYSIVELQLIAHPSPQPNTPTDYVVCDDGVNLYDGIASFDLASKDDEVLGEDIEPDTVLLTYHISEDEANSGANPIDASVPFTNTSNPQTIWVRLENIETGCFNIVHFDLIVAPLPTTIIPEPLEVCDDGPFNNTEDYLIASFDLESKTSEILDGQDPEEWMVYYFETLEQAEEGLSSDRLLGAYTNTINPQTVHVRIQSLNTGCFALTTLDLRVLPIPNANFEPNSVELCDNDEDGDDSNGFVSGFDLNEAALEILNGQVGASIVFYDSYEAALAEDAAHIIDHSLPYDNTVAFDQTIWAVVTDDLSDLSCKAYVPLHLIVNPLPEITTISSHIFCEEDDNGEMLVNLSELDIFIVANPDDLEFLDITYYATYANADAPINQLEDEFYLTEDTVFYARVENSETGCYRVAGGIVTSVAQKPEAYQPENLQLCDDDTDADDTNGIGVAFDLTSQTATIEGGQPDVTTTYYLSDIEALLEQNPIVSPESFSNTVNHQKIWARVQNISGCGEIVTFMLIVTPTPQFSVPTEPVLLCHEDIFITLEPTLEDSGSVYSYSWTDASGTVLGNEPTLDVENPGTYSITLQTDEACAKTMDITVIDSQQSLLDIEDLFIVDFAGEDNAMTINPTDDMAFIEDYVYSLDGGATSTDLHYPNLTGGEHTLEIINNLNCETQTITFTVVDYMRFFTPNNDGYNDYWQLLGISTQPGAKIHIFDRFGKLLAKVSPESLGWDGKFNGYQMPSSDYWFTIVLEDGRTKKGHFSLVKR